MNILKKLYYIKFNDFLAEKIPPLVTYLFQEILAKKESRIYRLFLEYVLLG